MPLDLTHIQSGTLVAIRRYMRTHRGLSPTFAELRKELAISANQTLIDRLVALEKKGWITRGHRIHRSIQLTPEARCRNHTIGNLGRCISCEE